MLIIDIFGSGKTNALLNSTRHHPDIDKIYLFAKDPYKGKYQLLINKCKSVGLKHFDDPKSFFESSNDMEEIYEKDC